MRIEPAQRLTGTLNPPGDKSISHRYALLAAMARGRSCIRNYSHSQDCHSTLDCLRRLGVSCHQEANQVTIESGGFARWKRPRKHSTPETAAPHSDCWQVP